jgi:hypothetical protein
VATQDPAITRLMNNIRMHIPGATDDVIQYELFNALDELFKGSNCWIEDIDVQIPGMDPAGTVYDLTPSGPSTPIRLMWVFTKPTDTSISRGSAVCASMAIPGELVLDTQPSSDVTYTATVALSVEDPTTRSGYVTFPEWVLAKYRDVVLDGVCGRMFLIPSKPWTNNQLAVMHSRKFKNGVARVRGETNRANGYRQQAWKFPPTAGGSQRGRSGGWAAPQ